MKRKLSARDNGRTTKVNHCAHYCRAPIKSCVKPCQYLTALRQRDQAFASTKEIARDAIDVLIEAPFS